MMVTKCCEEGSPIGATGASLRVTTEATVDAEAKAARCFGRGRERNRRLVQARAGLDGRTFSRQQSAIAQ